MGDIVITNKLVFGGFMDVQVIYVESNIILGNP